MLTPEETKSIASSGEGYNADFKVSIPSKVRELSREVCAFANSEGGYILIGIDNKNRIVGVAIDNTQRSAIQDAIRDISPSINVNTYRVDIDGKTVWVMDVPSGKDKPYVTSGAIYVRESANSQKLTTAEEIRSFFQSSNRIYFDAVPCPRFNIKEELDKKNFKQFLLASSISGNVSTQQILNNLQTFDESSNPGGLLLGVKKDFGKKSMTRNPLIFGLFTRMDLVEQVGSGIPRMREEMQEAGLPEPIFSTEGGFFTVEFKRPKKYDIVKSDNGTVNGTVNEGNAIKDSVFKLITENEGLSASGIAKSIGKSRRTTMRYLDLLKKEDKIEFKGAPKNGGYYIKS
ncbi:MAG: putative DNA binding domain-containing protein [Tannerellaceae bacterium]|jgi:predicted HTH transcriptional regulator|nr:putative DNA binding domain-containing protein [Tannerellaceae bacterium]